MASIPLAAQSYNHSSIQFDSQRLINLFFEQAPPTGEARAGYVLRSRPGLTRLTKLNDGPLRGIKVANSRLWVVSGNTLFSLDSLLNVTNRGTIVKANMATSRSGLRFRHLQRIMPNIPSPPNAANTMGDLWTGLIPKGSCKDAPTAVVLTVS